MRRSKLIKVSGIYQIQSRVNGKCYIGSAVKIKSRIKQGHFLELKKRVHGNHHLQNHVNKYGLDDLQFFILEFCSKEKLINREQYYIDLLRPEFNISPNAGSQFEMKHSDKTRQKMRQSHKLRSDEVNKHHSEVMKGDKNPMFGKHPIPWNKGLKGVQIPSEETRKKMSISHKGKGKGKIVSEETKKKISKAAKKRYRIKENNPMYGKKHSKESRRKMSESTKRHLLNKKFV